MYSFQDFVYIVLVSFVAKHVFEPTNRFGVRVCFVLPVTVQCVSAEPACKFHSDLHVFSAIGRQLVGLMLPQFTHYSVDKLTQD